MAVEKVIVDYEFRTGQARASLNSLTNEAIKAENAQQQAIKKTGQVADDSSKKRVDGLRKQAQETKKLTSANKDLFTTFQNIAGAIGLTVGIQQLKQAIVETTKLQARAKGIELSFNTLNQPGLLRNLRQAVQGTVSDLELMRQAVRADKFNVPLSQLAKFFEFASIRARQTGESVDYLVDSIITGIGRKSIQVIDNLSLSTDDFRKEVEKTGDYATALGVIIDREMANINDDIRQTVDETSRLAAEWQNLVVELSSGTAGDIATGVIKRIRVALQNITDDDLSTLERLTGFFAAIGGNEMSLLLAEAQANTAEWAGGTGNALDALKAKVDTFTLEQFQSEIQSLVLQLDGALQSGNTEKIKSLGEAIEFLRNALEARLGAGLELPELDEIIKFANTVDDILLPDVENAEIALQNYIDKEIELLSERDKRILKLEAEQDAKLLKQQEESQKQREQAEREHQQAVQALRQEFFNTASTLASALSSFQQSLYQQEQDDLQRQLQAGIISEEQYAQELSDIRRRQALADRQQALFNIAINTAQAITKAAAQSGGIGAATAGLIAAQGAIQAAVVLAQPIPEFATGTEYVQGPGTETSDSIVARLSKGERVVPANVNKQLFGIKNEDLADYAILGKQLQPIVKNIQNEKNNVAERLASSMILNSMSADADLIAHHIKVGSKNTHIKNVDEIGSAVAKAMRKQGGQKYKFN